MTVDTVYHGISLILLSLGILIVGMIKPKWILLWMDNPSRVVVVAISMVLFMIGSTLFAEGEKEKQQTSPKQTAVKKEQPATTAASAQKPNSPAPVAAVPPTQAPSTSANDLRP